MPKQSKDGYYRATFTIINSQGKKQRVEVYSKSEAELEKKLLEKKFEYERGLLIVNGKSTLEKWALEWLAVYKKGKIGEGAYKDYEQKIKKYIIPSLGQQKLCDIKHHHLQTLLNGQNKSKSNAKKLKNTIEQIFKTAEINGLINKNPALGLELPRLQDGKRRSITDEERKVILKVAEEHRAGLWLKIMLYCGLRPSEAVILDWDDIDLEGKRIKVHNNLDLKTNKIKEPKTDAGVRDVPIPDILLEELRQKAGRGFVFTQMRTGKHHTAESMRSMWENFVRHMEIEMGSKMYRSQLLEHKVADDLVPYCLRHTYGTDLQNAGVPINVAKYLMGHSDIRVTANIYTHQSQEASEAALKNINKYQSNVG